jgi:hypothetical protein
MRSKLFDVKIGDQNVSFGPEQIVKVFFDFMERDIDRIRSRSRIEFVRKTMGNLKFSAIVQRTKTMLSSSIRLSPEDEKRLADGINEIETLPSPEVDKSYRLGFLLYEYMGEDFVAKLYEEPEEDWKTKADLPEASSGIIPPIFSRDSKVLYFSYGKNMSSKHFMSETGYTDSETKFFLQTTQPRSARLSGYRLTFTRPSLDGQCGLPNLTRTGDPKDVVEGVAYRVLDETLRFVDSRRQNSRREDVTIEIQEGDKRKNIDAMTYVATQEVEGLLPRPEDLKLMAVGAKEHKLSESYVSHLLSLPAFKPVTS